VVGDLPGMLDNAIDVNAGGDTCGLAGTAAVSSRPCQNLSISSGTINEESLRHDTVCEIAAQEIRVFSSTAV
jgi:hypothetical protein